MEKDPETGNRKQETGNRKPGIQRGSDIAERLLSFAVAVMRLTKQLPKDTAGRHVASQILRSATSGGANYEEARAAESRDDFIHKIGVALKEVRESVFWLALIQRSGWGDASALIREAEELCAILGASKRTAKSRD
ncbi:MAG TPA: four helix bundle protein [Kofleriaceae bacterium]|nr:four helix bundle protein [Kofleriaceae bacterium]